MLVVKVGFLGVILFPKTLNRLGAALHPPADPEGAIAGFCGAAPDPSADPEGAIADFRETSLLPKLEMEGRRLLMSAGP